MMAMARVDMPLDKEIKSKEAALKATKVALHRERRV